MSRARWASAGFIAASAVSASLSAVGHANVMPSERQFIDQTLTVPAAALSDIGALLPEGSVVTGPLLSPSHDPNLVVLEPATVSVTFLFEGAGYRNAFGYFVYTLDGSGVRIVDRQLVFPNASFADPSKGWGGGQLVTGDTVTLRDARGAVRIFAPGERIGFFLVANGWNGTGVTGWNAAAPSLPSASSATNGSVANGVVTSIDALNAENAAGRPEVNRHVAMATLPGVAGFLGGEPYTVIGFEDLRRDGGSDNDFNDVVFVSQSTPIGAAVPVSVASFDPAHPDPDGDGVEGIADHFPDDPSRAFVVSTPSVGVDTVAFEDTYPDLGDYDFNDAVVQSSIETVSGADGRVKELVLSYHLVARGAGYDARFGVEIAGLPADVSGTVQFERFSSEGDHVLEPERSLASDRVVRDGATSLRLEVFGSTRAALSSPAGYANTTGTSREVAPSSVRVRVVFDTPLDPVALAAPPFDPFLAVRHTDGEYDIHLPGHRGFATRPVGLPLEDDATSFIDDEGHPWALLVPYDWRWPLEAVRIDASDDRAAAYPSFRLWAGSFGTTARTWYASPNVSSAARVTSSTRGEVRARAWTVRAGG